MALKKTKPSKNWIIIPGLALGVVLLPAYRLSLKPLGTILARMRLRGQDQHSYEYFGASRSGQQATQQYQRSLQVQMEMYAVSHLAPDKSYGVVGLSDIKNASKQLVKLWFR